MNEFKDFISQIFDENKAIKIDYSELEEEIDDLINNYILDILLENGVLDKEERKEILLKIINLKEKFKEEIEKFWLLDKIKIALVGKFSSGKSSIVNSIIGGKILPTDITPTTAIPSFVTYLPNTDGHFFAYDFTKRLKKVDISFLTSFNKEELAKFPIQLSALIKYFILPLNLMNIQSKMVDTIKDIIIIDTPGYNPGEGENSWDKARAIEAIEESDIVFWVIDVNDGDLSQDGINFISRNIKDKDFYVIINKCDTKPPKRLDIIKEQIEKTLRSKGILCKDIVLFSSRKNTEQYLESLLSVINNIKKEKEKEKELYFPTLIEYLESILSQYLDILYSYINESLNKSTDLDDLIQECRNALEKIDNFKFNIYNYINKMKQI